MSFATFSVTYNLPQNRLQLSFTLLLTAVTFKWVVVRCLPTISYLTTLVRLITDWRTRLFTIEDSREKFSFVKGQICSPVDVHVVRRLCLACRRCRLSIGCRTLLGPFGVDIFGDNLHFVPRDLLLVDVFRREWERRWDSSTNISFRFRRIDVGASWNEKTRNIWWGRVDRT